MRIQLLILAVFSAGTAGAAVCEPIGNLNSAVNYCDENVAYVAPAKKCFEGFKAQVDAENAKIKKILDGKVNAMKGSEQDADFEGTQAVLAQAEATLTNLIAQGKQAHTELEDYAYDLVLPIYEAYPEDFKVDAWSKEGKALFRDKECYGEPVVILEGFMRKIRPIVSDLEKTKRKVVSLHKVSGVKRTNLDSVDPAASVKETAGEGEAKVVPVKKGKGKKKESKITGVEEDQLKRSKGK